MGKDYWGLWRGAVCATDTSEAISYLLEILDDPDNEGLRFLGTLEGDDVEFCLELLDHGLFVGREGGFQGSQATSIFMAAAGLCFHHGKPLPSTILTGKVQVEDRLIASGGFATLRHGRYMGKLVAVKTMRVSAQGNLSKMRGDFCSEVTLWRVLTHPNIMQLTGVLGDIEKGQFVTVLEWMTQGNIMEYIRNNHVDRLELLHGAAQGLMYLHGQVIKHGSLKGANILISNDAPPRARLTDFCFKAMTFDPIQPLDYQDQSEGNSMVFMAPELLMPWKFGREDPTYTNEADIYAFAFVILQVLTGETPFHRLRQTQLMYYAMEGKRPEKPENASTIGLSDSLWNLTQRCWNTDEELRPNVEEVVTHLGEVAANWQWLMPPHGA